MDKEEWNSLKGNEESRLLVDNDEVEQSRMSLIRLSSSCGVLRECIGRSVWFRSVLRRFGGVYQRVQFLNSSTRIVSNEVYSRSCK